MADKEGAKKEILKLIERYDKVIAEKRFSKYTEEETKKDFILPLFRALGWETEDSSEVRAEESISKKRVDYSFRINGIPKFFLEAKALKEDLNNPKFVEQAINYSWHKGCTWAVLTDFESVRIFNAEWKTTNPMHSQLKEIKCKEFVDNLDDLWLLSRESFENGLIDKVAEKWGKKTKKISVDKQLLSDFTRFRELLSNNVTKLNQGKNITPEDLDEAIQRILDRLIFIRNCEDREMEEKKLWEAKNEANILKKLREVFNHFNQNYDSKIFSNHLCDELSIDNIILKEIIEGLYQTKDKSVSYDFSAIEADVLGNIYEQYLGHILKKTQKGAKLKESHSHRKEQGIYYTPTYIVDYIVKNTLGEMLKDKKIDVEKIRVLDPACGSGSFLIKAFDALNEYYEKHDKNYNQKTLGEGGTTYSVKERILKNNIFGVDLDRQAVEIAQLNLLLKIAEKGQRLPLLQQNIQNGNSLIDNENIAKDKAFSWKNKFEKIIKNEGGFDVIIGNPPYVRIQTLDESSVNFFNKNYESATKNYDIYALFVEKGISLLKENGVLGFILPSKFFNSDYGEGLRKIIADNKLLYKIVDFKDFQVFDGATTYTCLIFLKKPKNKDFEYMELFDKSGLSSTKNIKKEFFKVSKQELPNTKESWNFISNDSKALMNKLDKIKLRLGDISKNIFQGLVTGADKLYFVNMIEDKGNVVRIRNNFDKKEFFLEKIIVKKLLKGKEIRRWGIDWQKIYIIYPYEVKKNSARLISLDEIKINYPKTYQYFLNYEKELRAREKNRFKNEKDWHQFGRLQNIDKFEQPKIMTQVLSSKNSFTFDEKGEYYFVGGGNAGGYGIVLRNEYSKDYYSILGLLNSKLLEFYLRKISTPFRGGFYSYGKRFIERLPIIIPLEAEREKLAQLSKSQLERGKRISEIGDKKTDDRAIIEEEMKKVDDKINELVYKIYGVTEEEQEIIEGSLK